MAHKGRKKWPHFTVRMFSAHFNLGRTELIYLLSTPRGISALRASKKTQVNEQGVYQGYRFPLDQFSFPSFSLNISVLRAPCEICSMASFYCRSQGSPWTILHFPSRPFTCCLGATHPATQWVCDSAFSLGQVQLHAIGQFLFQGPDEKITDLFVHFIVCILMFLSSSFRKKEQELDGQKKVTCLLPIDFPVPFSGSLVSPNYSSAFSGSLGWDISHRGGLTVPQSPRGELGR